MDNFHLLGKSYWMTGHQYAVPQGQGETQSTWKGERERKRKLREKGKRKKDLEEPSG